MNGVGVIGSREGFTGLLKDVEKMFVALRQVVWEWTYSDAMCRGIRMVALYPKGAIPSSSKTCVKPVACPYRRDITAWIEAGPISISHSIHLHESGFWDTGVIGLSQDLPANKRRQ